MNQPPFLKDMALPGRASAARRDKPKRAGAKKEPGLYQRLADLYRRMEESYNACAHQAGLTCENCPDNCCVSFFRHHTYVEWSYLWRGLLELPEKRRRHFIRRAEDYMREANQALTMNALPGAMCPLNEDGLCALYSYRLMICRLHGTRNVFTRPDGQRQIFPGCVRFAALSAAAGPDDIPTLDRTPLYAELAALELEFHKRAARSLPRVNLTLAEMIVLGPPKLR